MHRDGAENGEQRRGHREREGDRPTRRRERRQRLRNVPVDLKPEENLLKRVDGGRDERSPCQQRGNPRCPRVPLALEAPGEPAAPTDKQQAIAQDEAEVDEDMLPRTREAGRPPPREDLVHAMGAPGELETEDPGAVRAHPRKRGKLARAEREHHDSAKPEQTPPGHTLEARS